MPPVASPSSFASYMDKRKQKALQEREEEGLVLLNATLRDGRINAMLLRAEILTELYRESNDKELFSQMTELYTNIHQLGYRKMPQQMYINWLNSLNAEDCNQGIKAILNQKIKID